MLKHLLGLGAPDIGIDLGTANTLVCVKGAGVVLSEPSVVAVRRHPNGGKLRCLAVGEAARAMIEKTPETIGAIRPLHEGGIADFDITEAMLAYVIRKALPRRWGLRPRGVIAVPSGLSAVERRAVTNAAERAGIRRVFLVSEPMAAAIGAGLPVSEPTGSMIVDIGGGTTEVAVLSLAGSVKTVCLKVAGDAMDEAIRRFVADEFGLDIGLRTAERIKIQIGSAAPLDPEKAIELKGRDTVAGLPRRTSIRSEQVRVALDGPVSEILQAVKTVLEQTPPELAADLVDEGIVLAGGGALLAGLDRRLAEETGLPVRLADDPMTTVATGTAILLDQADLMHQIIQGHGNGF